MSRIEWRLRRRTFIWQMFLAGRHEEESAIVQRFVKRERETQGTANLRFLVSAPWRLDFVMKQEGNV
jgi:hypothetical protein